MKKVISFALVAALMLSSASFAAPKKTKKSTSKSSSVAKKTLPAKQSDSITVSPKLGLNTGNGGSSFVIGCEISKPIMDKVDLLGDVNYTLPSNGVSFFNIGVNGIYRFDRVSGMPVDFYAGGGLSYNFFNVDAAGVGSFSSSGIGWQLIGGADIPVPSTSGTAFAQLEYRNASYSGTVSGSTFGIPWSVPVSGNLNGFVIAGGYRFPF